MCGVCSCYVAPAPPMTPRCPAEPAAAAHSCGQLRGKSAAAPRTAPALTSPLHNRDVPWPQPPHGQIWSRHRPGAADPRSGSEIFLWAFVNTTPEINYPLSPGRLVLGTSTWNFIPFEEIKITLVERATPSAEAGADHHSHSISLYLSTVLCTSDSTLPPYSLLHGPILLGLVSRVCPFSFQQN